MTNGIVTQPPAPVLRRTPTRRKKTSVGVPYAGATSGEGARAEATKWLRRLGCEQIGFMDYFEDREVLLAFTHRGRNVQLRASARGWATMYLKQHPYSGHRRRSRFDYEKDILRQGHVAVNSILRDWIKGQVTAIETGILSFEEVFLPYMLTADGRRVIERVQELLLSRPNRRSCHCQNRRPEIDAGVEEQIKRTGVDVELVTGAEADKLFTKMTQRLQMSGAQKQVEKPI